MQKNYHIIFLLKQYSYAYLSFNCVHLHIQIEYKTFQQYSEHTFERYFHHNWVSQSITFSAKIKLKNLKCCSNIVKHVRNVTVNDVKDISFHLMFGRCFVFQFYMLFPNKSYGPYLDAFHKISPPKTLL